jgi:hypothetical protein
LGGLPPTLAYDVAWRDIVGNLLEYFEQLESFHKQKSKEYTKLSKTPEVPFKNPESAPDGIALIYQAIRDKNLQLANYHAEEAPLLKAGTIADLGRLRADLKKHLGDLEKEGVKGSRKVEKKMDKFVTSRKYVWGLILEWVVAVFGQVDSRCGDESYVVGLES